MKNKKRLIGCALAVFIAGLFANMALAGYRGWHTRPDKWKEARVFHTSFEKRYAEKIKTGRDLVAVKPAKQVWSSNKGYYYFVSDNDFMKPGPFNTVVSICNERDYLVQISVNDHRNITPTVKWINEKLLHVEIWWGRVLGTDIIFDVESEKIIYKEMNNWGGIAFLQWKQEKQKLK